MATDKLKSRPSVSEILEGQNWERKEYLHLSSDDITELVGSYSGVPKVVYRMAMELDRKLDEAFINKLRLCKRSTERGFANRYEQVVLALAFGLDDLKKKIHRTYDTDQGSIMEVKLPLNLLYMFVGLGEGLLRFEIVDQEPSGTLVRADAEVIGIALLKKDWGYGRRNMNAVLDRASEHLRRMRGG